MMRQVIEAFIRALGYALLPRVIGMSLLPLLLMALAALGLGWLFWDGAVAGMDAALKSSALLGWLNQQLSQAWPGGVTSLLAPLLVIALAMPLIALASLVLVSVMMTPALARLVARRRFAGLERGGDVSLFGSIAWSTGAILIAIAMLLVTMPLWLIPPFALVLPPLIWGWLTYRVMGFDVLAQFASAAERKTILRQHRWPLLLIGVVSGYLGAAPAVVWASGVVFATLFMALVPLAIWIYTMVFAFSSLWFAHYCLQALQTLRAVPAPAPAPVADVPLIELKDPES
ncbi:MAG: EI24 domain-containing protein [Burkholderiaceae bacterium]|jgi:hypothetical protein|nr:EI24 domain-containing protein [Burkholderiaceae bacterium]